MKNVSDGFKTASLDGTVHRELRVYVFGETGIDVTISNNNIVFESMRLTQAMCDEPDLKFGGAVSSSFEIDTFGINDLTGRYITVTLIENALMPTYPGEHCLPGEAYPGYTEYSESFNIFSGEVYSCELSKNHITRHVVAYDRFYWRGGINCAEWYSDTSNAFWHIYPGVSYCSTTVGELRKALCEHYGIIEAYPTDILPADNMEIEQVTGKVTVGELLNALCEMSGVFCVLNGSGNIEYHTISENSDITNIRKPGTENYGFTYADCEYKEFEKQYTGMAYRGKNGHWYGLSEGNSFYVLDGNIIVGSYSDYTSWEIEMGDIDWHHLLKYIRFNSYTPMNLKVPYRPWVELGDKITFSVHFYEPNGNGGYTDVTKTITSYVLSRTISGIQTMTDEFTANAENVMYDENNVFDEEEN